MTRQTMLQVKKESQPLQTGSLFRRQATQVPVEEHDIAPLPVGFGRDYSHIPFRPQQPPPPMASVSCAFSPQRCPFGGACHSCPPRVQAKLKIGQPGDRYEQEADRVAEQVMRMPEPQVQRKCAAPGCKDEDDEKKLLQTKPLAEQITPLVQRQTEPEAEKDEDEDEIVQAKSASSAGRAQADHPLIQSVLSSPGQPLDAGTRSFMEPRFGQDFSGVRVHVGGKAAESARAVNARAYTVGRDVVFGEGQYAPGSDEGKRLVAHELTHIAQQARYGDAVKPRMEVSCPEDSSEREADLASDAVAGGASFTVREAPSARIVRKISASAPEPWELLKQSAFNVFEVPSATTAAGASAAFDAYIALSASDQERARSWSYSTGNLQKALAALGTVNTVDPKYADAVHGILRWIKETQPHESTSNTDDKIVKPQTSLFSAAQTSWPERGNISSSEQQQTVEQQRADKNLAENHSGSVTTNQQADDYQHSPVDQKKQNSTDNAAKESAEESAAPAQAAPPVSVKSPAVKGDSEGKVTAEAVKASESTPSEAPDPREAIAPAANAVRQRAAGARRHPSATAPVSSAQAAAKDPKTEQARGAAEQTVENIDAAGKETKEVERERFKTELKKALDKATPEPKTESEAERVMKQGAKEASQTLHGQLATERDTAAGPLKSAASREMPPSEKPAPPKTELQPEQVGPPPAPVAAAPAVPEPLPSERLDYSSDHAPADQLMAENNISTEQLEEGNEPAFGQALEARSAAKEHESTVEARYRQSESEVQEQAQGKAQQALAQGLVGLHGERKLRIGQVAGQQTATQSKDATERQRVTQQINTIKDKTRADVKNILDSMATEAGNVFKDGLDAAEKAYGTAFEEAKGGIGTWLTTWGDDWKRHIEASLKTARQKYLNVVEAAIDKVADLVGKKLADARQRVVDGREEVKKFVAGLDGSVKQYGEEALKAVSADFDSMESEIDKRRDGLIENLTQQYKESYERMSAKEEELRAENKSLWQRVYDATVGIVEKIIEFKNMLLGVLGRAADVVGDIIAHPIRFLGNLVDGVKLGLNNFMANIERHLQQALMGWLFGTMAEAGIQLPEQFDSKGILSLVLQVLGLTYANIRKRAVNLLGEKLVSRLEQAAEIFKILITEGPGGLWEYIKEKLGNLKAMVFDEIERFVTESIVVAGIKWIVSLLNPAVAFIKACMAIYDIIKFFIERAAQVLALVNAVIESLAAIVAGNISGAAKFVEDALGKALPVVIGFLASLLGLGGISAKIRSIIEKIQQPVNTAIDWVINKAVKMVKTTGGTVKDVLKSWFKIKKHFTDSSGKSHSLSFRGDAAHPQLIMRSEPETFEIILRELRDIHKGNSTNEGKIKKIEGHYKIIKEYYSDKDESYEKIDKSLDVIGELISSLITDENENKKIKSYFGIKILDEKGGFVKDEKLNFTKEGDKIKSNIEKYGYEFHVREINPIQRKSKKDKNGNDAIKVHINDNGFLMEGSRKNKTHENFTTGKIKIERGAESYKLTYTTKRFDGTGEQSFEVNVHYDDIINNNPNKTETIEVEGKNLIKKKEGAARGVHDSSEWHGFHNAHLIADRFGGSGKNYSHNIYPSSPIYNTTKEYMRGKEDKIAGELCEGVPYNMKVEAKFTHEERGDSGGKFRTLIHERFKDTGIYHYKEFNSEEIQKNINKDISKLPGKFTSVKYSLEYKKENEDEYAGGEKCARKPIKVDEIKEDIGYINAVRELIDNEPDLNIKEGYKKQLNVITGKIER